MEPVSPRDNSGLLSFVRDDGGGIAQDLRGAAQALQRLREMHPRKKPLRANPSGCCIAL